MFYFIIIILLLVTSIFLDQKIYDWLFANTLEKEITSLNGIIKDFKIDVWQRKRYKVSKNSLYLLLLWPLIQFKPSYFIGILVCSVLLYKTPYLSLLNNKKKIMQQMKFQFPIWLRQIQILLQNNTVVKAIELSYSQAPNLIQIELPLLIESLKSNPNDLKVYTQFLSEYNMLDILRAMKLLYRYNTIGKDDSYQQFNRMIQSTTKWLRNSRNQSKEDKLLLFQWWGMAPLFGVTVVFLMIMFSLITNLFGKGVAI